MAKGREDVKPPASAKMDGCHYAGITTTQDYMIDYKK
jgi:hypothetical protein